MAEKAEAKNNPDDDGEDAGPEEIGVRKGKSKRRDAEDRNPDDELATVTVTDRAAEDGAERDGKEEKEQMELRPLDREMEFVNQEKGIVIR